MEKVVMCRVAVQCEQSEGKFCFAEKYWRPLAFFDHHKAKPPLKEQIFYDQDAKMLKFCYEPLLADGQIYLALKCLKQGSKVVNKNGYQSFTEDEMIEYFFPKHFELLNDRQPLSAATTDDMIAAASAQLMETEQSADENQEETDEFEPQILKKYVSTQLFEDLYVAHEQHADDDAASADLQLPAAFQPKLCRFQQRTVRWLLKREQQQQIILANYYYKMAAADGTTIVYRHKYDAHYVAQLPEMDGDFPFGGILAEEMGLGKTVEMLALVMLHPRRDIKMPAFLENGIKETAKKRKRFDVQDDNFVLCVCGSNKSTKKADELLECMYCHSKQHFQCLVSNDQQQTSQQYLCPSCWHEQIQLHGLLPTKGTCIVTPQAIKSQWLTEILRHTNPALRVLDYKGVSSKWHNPRDLASYDIVLTDYTVLTQEFYYSTALDTDRTSRNKRRTLQLHTPLAMLHWWRVCLDEAQMVESNVSKSSILVRQLAAVNYWAVTGTPIQRSIDDLLPLLTFIGLEHVNSPKNVWSQIAMEYVLLREQPNERVKTTLIDLLQKCMWRTCKSKVWNELNIPPQHQVLHSFYFTDLERFYYQDMHRDCNLKFQLGVAKHVNDNSTGIINLSPTTLKSILKPLLKIRQCCVIPVISNKQMGSGLNQRMFLQLDDLHNHLTTNIELECKSELRAAASALNGIAAIKFLQLNYAEAKSYYRRVLKLADDYNNEPSTAIRVDSLLQIHALHNMLQAHNEESANKNAEASTSTADPMDEQSVKNYAKQCDEMEWKYLQQYVSNLNAAKSEYMEAQRGMQIVNNKYNMDFNDFLDELSNTLLDATDIEMRNHCVSVVYSQCCNMYYNNVKAQQLYSLQRIIYFMSGWHENVKTTMQSILAKFEELEKFSSNCRCRNDVPPDMWQEIMTFVRTVFECHLSEIRENNDETNETPTTANQQRQKLCLLCELQLQLNAFECLLFKKTVSEENAQRTDGVEHPSLEVFMIKTLIYALKQKLRLDSVQQLDRYFYEATDSMDALLKKLTKYWIEIEYTVKAYDELDMCKMRTQLFVDTNDNMRKTNYRITREEFVPRLMEQQSNLNTAERNLVTHMARLRYIRHLNGKTKLESCPICMNEASEYAVLQCGHHLCRSCLHTMVKNSLPSREMRCFLCRHKQTTKELFYLTSCFPKENKGMKVTDYKYSSKITYIVNLVLQLKNESIENNKEVPKILIFSQWEFILKAIAIALQENNITHRIKWNDQTIKEFKNPVLGITCLLMPLSRGAKGLNLIEATHVFLVEPILNPADELQAIGRVHRFGQTKETTVHRFIIKNTIEENLYNLVHGNETKESKWEFNNLTVADLLQLFNLDQQRIMPDAHQLLMQNGRPHMFFSN